LVELNLALVQDKRRPWMRGLELLPLHIVWFNFFVFLLTCIFVLSWRRAQVWSMLHSISTLAKDCNLLRMEVTSLWYHELLLAIEVWSTRLYPMFLFFGELYLMRWSACTHLFGVQLLDANHLVHSANANLNGVLSRHSTHASCGLLLVHVEVGVRVLDITHVRAFLLQTHLLSSVCMRTLSASTVLTLEAPHRKPIRLGVCCTLFAMSTHQQANRLVRSIHMGRQQDASRLIAVLLLRLYLHQVSKPYLICFSSIRWRVFVVL